MRVRTYLGILLSLLAVVAAAILTHLNADLLRSPFQLTPETTVPFYALLLGVFLTAFLPTTTLLLAQSVKRDLEIRSQRKAARQQDSLQRAYRRGVDAMVDGHWQRAADEFEVVLESRPQDFELLLRHGTALRQLGRVDEAVDLHRGACVLFPKSVALLYQLALDYEARGEAKVADEIRSRIARDFPEVSLRALRRKRNSALEGADWRLASKYQERIEGMLGKESAELESETAVAMGLQYQRGVAYLEEDRLTEAREIFQGLLVKEPRFVPAAIMLGEAERLSERDDAAIHTWLEGYKATGDPVFLHRSEDFFIERTNPDGAIEALWSLISQVENDLFPRFFLGRLYYRLEMRDEALKVLESIRDRVASSPTYHFLLARIYERREEFDQALEELRVCADQAGVPNTEYFCQVCSTKYPDWRGRCDQCGSWNGVRLDFQEERVSASELGVRDAPVWGGYGELSENPGSSSSETG